MAGRSRRHVASESSQRRDDIPADRDRCVFETGVVHSAEEQVGGVAGGRLQTVAKRRQQQQHTDYVEMVRLPRVVQQLDRREDVDVVYMISD